MGTNLVIRNVDEAVVLALRQQAESHGRSEEAEHLEILKLALQKPGTLPFTEALASVPTVGEDADLDGRRIRQRLDAEAAARYARIIDSERTVAWSGMRKFLEDRILGATVAQARAANQAMSPKSQGSGLQ
jgi:plasmid stability protein